MSFFSPWKTLTENDTASTSNPPSSSNEGRIHQNEGPITAPGGWSNLLTWRPQKPLTGITPSSSAETFLDADSSIAGPSRVMNSRNDQMRESPSRIKMIRSKNELETFENEEYENESEMRLFTARTRQKGVGGGGAIKSRAPIPFEFDSRPKARSGTISSIASSNDSREVSSITSWPLTHPPDENRDAVSGNNFGSFGKIPRSSQFKSTDSADVSAELLSTMNSNALEGEGIGVDLSHYEGAMGDLSVEIGALDSAFETLTRIKAKDVASKTIGSSNRSIPSSSSSTLPSNLSNNKESNQFTSRKPSFGAYYTPNESPTQPSGTWMQWGTNKIKATMPRGLASALFAIMGDPILNGDADETRKGSKSIDEEPRGVEDLSDDETDQEEYGRILVHDCIELICDEKNGLLDLEGLFRVSPSNSLLKSTKEAYVRGEKVNLPRLIEEDKHLPAALLKDYLRSLQPPVFPPSTYDSIRACPKDESEAIQYIRTELAPLIRSDRLNLLQDILKCIHMVAQHSDNNRMDSTNLAVVISPNLLHGKDVLEDIALCAVGKNCASPIIGVPNANQKNEKMTLGDIVKLSIERYEELFDEGQEEK